jgi:predicted metallo-beta-lactamase superfamily hydrolase
LPDVDSPIEFEQAREFLRRENTHESESTASGTETYESIFRYGRSKINKKYRNVHKVVSKTNGSWNLIYNAI